MPKSLPCGCPVALKLEHGFANQCSAVDNVQGSSPAALHKKEIGEIIEAGESSETAEGREGVWEPAPLYRHQSISQIRPLYSFYVPQSQQQLQQPSEGVAIPDARPRIARAGSMPDHFPAPGVERRQELCTSLPAQLKGQLPSRSSLKDLLSRPKTSITDTGSISSAKGDVPLGRSPSFGDLPTLGSGGLNRRSLFRDMESGFSEDGSHHGGTAFATAGGTSAASAAAVAAVARDLQTLKPIPEDAIRPSLDISRHDSGSRGHDEEAGGSSRSRPPSAELPITARPGSREVRWGSDSYSPSGQERGAESERTVLGQSPTADVLLERRASQKLPITPQPTIPEDADSAEEDASPDGDGQDAFGNF